MSEPVRGYNGLMPDGTRVRFVRGKYTGCTGYVDGSDSHGERIRMDNERMWLHCQATDIEVIVESRPRTSSAQDMDAAEAEFVKEFRDMISVRRVNRRHMHLRKNLLPSAIVMRQIATAIRAIRFQRRLTNAIEQYKKQVSR